MDAKERKWLMALREPGILGNDRKFEAWVLSRPTDRGYACEKKLINVYAVPNGGYRGSRVSKFRASYDGVVFEDTDIMALWDKVNAHHVGLSDSEFEKVLIVELGQGFSGKASYEEASLEWSVGWLVRRLGFMYDVTKTYKRSDVPISAWDTTRGIEHGCTKAMAVVPWTQVREDTLTQTLGAIRKLRESIIEALKDPEEFALRLDNANTNRLLGEPIDAFTEKERNLK